MGKLKNVLWTLIVLLFAAPVAALAFFSLPFSGWKALSVQTGSMVPKLPIGSVVLVHKTAASQLKVGDVITYKSLAKPITITHRIVQINTLPGGYLQFITKGDANATPDVPGVGERQIVGKINYSLPGIGGAVDFVRTIPGLLLCVYLPAVLLAGYEIHVLVATLSKIKLEEYKAQWQARQRAALAKLYQKRKELRQRAEMVHAEVGSVKEHRPRPIPIVLLLLVVCAVITAGGATYAFSSRSAELTNISISSAPVAANRCTSVKIVGLNFPNNDDEDKVAALKVCAPTCPVPGTPGWTLSNDEGQSWRHSRLMVTCATTMPASPLPQSNSWDLFTLVEGRNGHQIDSFRWQDDDD